MFLVLAKPGVGSAAREQCTFSVQDMIVATCIARYADSGAGQAPVLSGQTVLAEL